MSHIKTSNDELVTYRDEDAIALFPEFSPAPGEEKLEPLRLPLCLPQGSTGTNTPFARAHCPELRDSGIEMDDWLHFVDGLNIAMSASPPLRVVELAGIIIGFVPYHWAMLAGASMQVAARTGIHVIAKTLTDRYLRRANAEYFAPRGLRARICKTSAMRQLIGRDPTPDPSVSGSTSAKVAKVAKGAGWVAETVVLHLPIIRRVYNLVAPSVPSIPAGQSNLAGVGRVTARRLAMIDGYALPLDFDIPPAPPEEGVMNKASGLSVRLQAYRARQAEAKTERKRQLLAIQEGRATGLTIPPNRESRNVFGKAWDWRQARMDMLAEQRALRRAKWGLVDRDLQSSVEIADRKEWNATDRLLWVVLLTSEQDAVIQGRELIDDDADVEEIAEYDWSLEVQYENVEDKEILKNEETKGDGIDGIIPTMPCKG